MVLSHNKHGMEAAMELDFLHPIARGEVIIYIVAWVIAMVVMAVM